jgi:hypothetical protein
VEWILYYLRQEEGSHVFLLRDKANVLIEMAKTCLMCPGRYNEVFDMALKRLKGEPIEVPTFEKQVQSRLADLRSRTLTAIVHEKAHGCTHSRENLVFHLHRDRAIAETKPESIFTAQEWDGKEYYHFTMKSDAIEVFDAAYTPQAIAEVFIECVREGKRKTQGENDFNELLLDAMIDAYAKTFPDIQTLEKKMKVKTLQQTPYEETRPSRKDIEALFKPIDSTYQIPRQGLTAGESFVRFKKDFLGPKIRPLKEDLMGYAFPEVIHPLILGWFLCDAGLLQRKKGPLQMV